MSITSVTLTDAVSVVKRVVAEEAPKVGQAAQTAAEGIGTAIERELGDLFSRSAGSAAEAAAAAAHQAAPEAAAAAGDVVTIARNEANAAVAASEKRTGGFIADFMKSAITFLQEWYQKALKFFGLAGDDTTKVVEQGLQDTAGAGERAAADVAQDAAGAGAPKARTLMEQAEAKSQQLLTRPLTAEELAEAAAQKAKLANEAADKAKAAAEAAAENAKKLAAEAEKAKGAAAEAEQARLAAEQAEQTRIAAEQAEQARLAAEKDLAAKKAKAAEVAKDLADPEFARLVQQARREGFEEPLLKRLDAINRRWAEASVLNGTVNAHSYESLEQLATAAEQAARDAFKERQELLGKASSKEGKEAIMATYRGIFDKARNIAKEAKEMMALKTQIASGGPTPITV